MVTFDTNVKPFFASVHSPPLVVVHQDPGVLLMLQLLSYYSFLDNFLYVVTFYFSYSLVAPHPADLGRTKFLFPSPGFTPPTPQALPNFLETVLVPYRFRSVGGVGGVGGTGHARGFILAVAQSSRIYSRRFLSAPHCRPTSWFA